MGVPGPPSTPHPTTRLVGTAPAIEALRSQIRHLATFDSVGSSLVPTLLLQGETGTGKGLVARVVHDSGPRTTGPFIDVNCAAIPETMLEAELFGFEPGAFTDAKHAKPGLFEAASGGTLFLDEVDALPEDVLSRGLAHLQRVELLVPLRLSPTPVFTFKHILTQEVAYRSLPPDSRRQAHKRIAEVLLAQFPEIADTQPEVLAQHSPSAGR